MRTRREILRRELDREAAIRAIYNIESGPLGAEFLSEEASSGETAFSLIDDCFVWFYTPEGSQYWREVASGLRAGVPQSGFRSRTVGDHVVGAYSRDKGLQVLVSYLDGRLKGSTYIKAGSSEAEVLQAAKELIAQEAYTFELKM